MYLLIRVAFCLIGAVLAIRVAGWWSVAAMTLIAATLYVWRRKQKRRMQLCILSSYLGEHLAASAGASYRYLASLDHGFVALLRPGDASTFWLRPEARQIRERLRYVWAKEQPETAIFDGEREVTLAEFIAAFETWCTVYGSLSNREEPMSRPVEA